MLTWWGPTFAAPMVAFAAMPALGLLAGVLAKVGDELPTTWSAELGTSASIWILIIAVIGRSAPSARSAAGASILFFSGMLLGYYAFGFFARGYDDFTVAAPWMLLTATLCPGLAATIWWASRGSEAVASIPLTLLASGLFLDGAVIRAWRRWTGEYVVPGAPDMTVQAVFDLVVAAIIVVAIPRRRSVRLAALLLIVPMAWTVSEVVQPMLFDLIGWGAIV